MVLVLILSIYFFSNIIALFDPPSLKDKISEIIEIAISSGVLAPISIPTGAFNFWKDFSSMPSYSNFSIMRIVFLLDPNNPT